MAEDKKTGQAESGMVYSVPTDNRPIYPSSVLATPPNPAYDNEDEPLERTNVLLRNGTTVSIAEYDEEVHGPAIEETDDDYRTRMKSQPSGRLTTGFHARTTIPNLHTFDSTQVAAEIALPVLPPVIATFPSKAVVTTDEPNKKLVPMPGADEETILQQREAQLATQQTAIDQQRQAIERQREEREQQAEKMEERKQQRTKQRAKQETKE
jgi:hypothetical protein